MTVSVTEPFEDPKRLLFSFFKRMALLPRSWRLKCGRFVNSDHSYAVQYIGEGESMAFLRNNRLKDWQFQKQKSVFCLNTNSRFCQNCVMIVELNRLGEKWCTSPLIAYPWIRQKVDLNGSYYAKKRRAIEDKYGRKARKFSYRYRTSRDRDAVDEFYDLYYLPYIRWRFDRLSHVRPRAEFHRALRHKRGLLFQIENKGEVVAAIFCLVTRKQITSFAVGLLPDYQIHLKQGALSAGYYFIINWSRENGIPVFDLLRSRPFINDGVYNHKKCWGAEPFLDAWPHTFWAIHIPHERAVPQELQPLLVFHHKKFVPLYDILSRPSSC